MWKKLSHTTDHQHIARMQSEIYLVDIVSTKDGRQQNDEKEKKPDSFNSSRGVI
jgi:hypothetical protein